MNWQRTIRSQISAYGVGVHSGKKTNITLSPAPPNHGITFSRVDLEPQVTIKALAENVVDTRLSTCLGNNKAKISTIEHLMSAVAGLGIDNLRVEVDNEEIPIMDGSAINFIFLLKSAGIINQQSAPKKFIKIEKPIKLQLEDKLAEIKPYHGFKIDFTIDFKHKMMPKNLSYKSIEISTTSFIHDIAKARTFGFLKDIQSLQKMNLAMGGSLENSIVLDEESILNDSLRFEDEFVRHKILDAIGDLSLLGMPVLGHFIGVKSGHTLNNQLAKAILNDKSAWSVVTFEESTPPPIHYTKGRNK